MKKILMLTIGAAIVTSLGCNTVGPRTIRGARLNYNEAIARSWDQQLLLNLVRLKYRDTPFFLEVGSVSTQYNMNYTMSASPGFSTSEGASRGAAAGASGVLTDTLDLAADGSLSKGRTNDHGRDLGFDTGVSFDESPTVLYTPLQGQEFVTQMLAPIPLEAVMLLSESGWSVERVLRMCLEEMNGLDNASAASGPTPTWVPPYADFTRVTKLLRELQVAGAIELAIEKTDDAVAVLLMVTPEAQELPKVKELRELLRLDSAAAEYPMVRTRFRTRPLEIAVRSRSLLGVMYFLSEGVEVPPRHAEEGRVTVTLLPDGNAFEWSEVLGDLLQIRSQDGCPEDAYVRIHYRGKWFYIDDADLNSKSTFGLLSYLFYLQAGDIQSITPALTLPLGR